MKYIILFLVLIGLQANLALGSKCKCDCTKYPYSPVCAKELKTGDTETFNNVCQLQCYNCTHMKNYVVIYSGSC
uniref:Kazal peptide Pr13a n=1 Tax=Platymeris rhadamanthus TaxID=1134088 RepID=PR13A_PLARH|nr:RecName: Full=Kazal peptide Pr13a; AltName: Full=Venom Kazal domain peptide Pr13a; Flags: Precursor [Platymeris rhadamanthus]QHB21517.1 venom Kazal domain peptide Pr13a [Platymeris rhadamanthus]